MDQRQCREGVGGVFFTVVGLAVDAAKRVAGRYADGRREGREGEGIWVSSFLSFFGWEVSPILKQSQGGSCRPGCEAG